MCIAFVCCSNSKALRNDLLQVLQKNSGGFSAVEEVIVCGLSLDCAFSVPSLVQGVLDSYGKISL